MSLDRLPELLCPAGTPEALRAAIEGGADAVYFGGPTFNARMRATNFTSETMAESIALCHAFGVKAYVTLNTLCRDKEYKEFLQAAELAWDCGADALIVADLGGAALLRRVFPDFELHASTQMSIHNTAGAKELAALGFSRVVLARETPARDMRYFVANCGVETEVFVHGALCVSHSGQCLFSSLVGGRSGNRGECAQPCRLQDASGKYPLSLKDLSLARHIPALIEMGVHSLKIEGRLKSPEYVRDVTRIFRTLLDERRGASPQEMRTLADIFSRGGFTDAYFTERISKEMLGVRSETDKAQSRKSEPFTGLLRKVPLDMTLLMRRDEPLLLTVSARGKTATVTGDIPFPARTAPMGEDALEKCLCRLGATPYEKGRIEIRADAGLMLPVSRLNDLRRRAIAALADPPRAKIPAHAMDLAPDPPSPRPTAYSARFYRPEAIFEGAMEDFEQIYLPVSCFAPPANGVFLPPVIFDHEVEDVRQMLQKAIKRGAKHALCGNLGQLALLRETDLVIHGDFRLNATNGQTVAALNALGFTDVLLSPELTLPQIRDIGGACDAIIYGRIPLMLLEKCVGKEVGSCAACASDQNQYVDRRGEKFPVLRIGDHRNELLNSRPTVMSDRRAELVAAGIKGGHFLFSTESAEQAREILDAYHEGRALALEKRRI